MKVGVSWQCHQPPMTFPVLACRLAQAAASVGYRQAVSQFYATSSNCKVPLSNTCSTHVDGEPSILL
eukprot:5379055-Amphidinium_carterae.1